jgi:hypothetical protein
LKPEEEDDGEVQFSVDLDLLLVRVWLLPSFSDLQLMLAADVLQNCLSIFGSGDNTTVRLSYEGYGSPLSLM